MSFPVQQLTTVYNQKSLQLPQKRKPCKQPDYGQPKSVWNPALHSFEDKNVNNIYIQSNKQLSAEQMNHFYRLAGDLSRQSMQSNYLASELVKNWNQHHYTSIPYNKFGLGGLMRESYAKQLLGKSYDNVTYHQIQRHDYQIPQHRTVKILSKEEILQLSQRDAVNWLKHLGLLISGRTKADFHAQLETYFSKMR